MAPNRAHQPYVASLAVNLNRKSDNATKSVFQQQYIIFRNRPTIFEWFFGSENLFWVSTIFPYGLPLSPTRESRYDNRLSFANNYAPLWHSNIGMQIKT